MKPNDKLYVVVRGDLTPGQQMAQAVHAALRFAVLSPAKTREWMDVSEHICIVAVPDVQALKGVMSKCIDHNVACVSFNEASMNNELTAIAIAPGKPGIVREFPLALRDAGTAA